MSTPLYEAVRAYVEKNRARFHMPGHKGRMPDFLQEAARWDITEVDGADSLYEASGAIAACEARYARLYGSAATLLCAGGSTLCLQTMLALAAKPGSTVIAGRGVHTGAVNAMALLDLQPVWVFSPTDPATGLTAPPGAPEFRAALQKNPHAAAVYITSPTYLGALSDIQGISAVCKEFGVPLLVDNAHGAHLAFLPQSLHPLCLGADMCCDSLHKTLPVLTGGAALHIANPRFVSAAKQRMSLFGSTSPSYLILLSADRALAYLQSDAQNELATVCARVATLRETARRAGFGLPAANGDPARLCVDFAAAGYTQQAFAEHLRTCGIEPEYLGGRFCVFLPSGQNTPEDFARLERALGTPSKRPAVPFSAPPALRPRMACSLRQAVFAPSRYVALEQAHGKIAGCTVAPCPPGIPLVLPGEKLDSDGIFALKSYGIFGLNVLE